MSTTSFALADSATMLRRNLLHVKRYPTMTFGILVMPVVLMLVFTFVFGGALEKSSGGNYIDYLTPGMMLMLPAYLTVSVAVSITTDKTKGIVNRFRTMAISQSSMLAGQVVGALIQALIGVVLMVSVALLVGFRPNANPVEWLAVFGLIGLVMFAFSWLGVAIGLVAPTPEAASNMPFPLVMLPFLGSGLVATDTMPVGMRQFAEYQPFTPLTETLRGLLMGTEIGANGIVSIAWCAGLGLVGYVWAMSRFRKQVA
ncbi:ABC transporter permease [Nocardia sp. NPDC050793]|uniref:ABC transporter permease n=1 Tax=Nocardia sp. NPDC050793 TaxID=3155159 RepID=UPI0033C2EE04